MVGFVMFVTLPISTPITLSSLLVRCAFYYGQRKGRIPENTVQCVACSGMVHWYMTGNLRDQEACIGSA